MDNPSNFGHRTHGEKKQYSRGRNWLKCQRGRRGTQGPQKKSRRFLFFPKRAKTQKKEKFEKGKHETKGEEDLARVFISTSRNYNLFEKKTKELGNGGDPHPPFKSGESHPEDLNPGERKSKRFLM